MNNFAALLLWATLPSAAPVDQERIALDTVRVAGAADSIAATSLPLDSIPHPPVVSIAQPLPSLRLVPPAPDLQQSRRPHAITYSDWYGRRLTIHRLGSYTMFPLFGAEYWLGNKLLNDQQLASWVRPSAFRSRESTFGNGRSDRHANPTGSTARSRYSVCIRREPNGREQRRHVWRPGAAAQEHCARVDRCQRGEHRHDVALEALSRARAETPNA
jgi:hypothetical protein